MSPTLEASLVMTDSGNLKEGASPFMVLFNHGVSYLVSGHMSRNVVSSMVEQLLKKRATPSSATIYRMERTLSYLRAGVPAVRVPTLLDLPCGHPVTLVKGMNHSEDVHVSRPFIIQAGKPYGTLIVRKKDSSTLTLFVSPDGTISPAMEQDGTRVAWKE